jgi:hypothetical protein
LFPNGQPADLIHAWTPREAVRKFVLGYQRLLPKPARLIIHLEDNERFLIEAYTAKSFATLRAEARTTPACGSSTVCRTRSATKTFSG